MVSLAEAKAAKRKELEEQTKLRADAIRGVSHDVIKSEKGSMTNRKSKGDGVKDSLLTSPVIKSSKSTTPKRRTQSKKDLEDDDEDEDENEYTVKSRGRSPNFRGSRAVEQGDVKKDVDANKKTKQRRSSSGHRSTHAIESKRLYVPDPAVLWKKGKVGPYKVSKFTFYISIIAAIVPLLLATFGEDLYHRMIGQVLISSPFCDSTGSAVVAADQQEECTTCPHHGVCTGGYLIGCVGSPTWMFSDDRKRCVFDREFDGNATLLYSTFMSLVRRCIFYVIHIITQHDF